MKYIYNRPSFILGVTFTLSLFNIAIASDTPSDAELSTDEAQVLFEQAMEERDTGKIDGEPGDQNEEAGGEAAGENGSKKKR